MVRRLVAAGILLFIVSTVSAFAQTNVVANPSFEGGLTSWTFGQFNEAGAAGNCSYNAVTAPGTETLTSTAGWPATAGTGIVLGSVQSTSGLANRTNCVLYQDVAIPVGATTGTLRFDVGVKAGNDGCGNVGGFVGLYSTASVPGILSPSIGGASTSICQNSPDATLVSYSAVKNLAAVAGTTVRLAFINGAFRNGGEVIGIDNVQFLMGPGLTSVTPNTGSTAGGNTVTLAGTGFTGATGVTFGGTAATSFTVNSDTRITVTVPAHAAGAVSVLVTTPGGTNAANTLYTYAAPVPALGPWGLAGLAILLLAGGWLMLRRATRQAAAI